MKKIILMITMLLAFSNGVFADDKPVIANVDSISARINKVYNAEDLFFHCNYRRVGCFLGITLEQLDDMSRCMDQFNKDILFASEADNDFSRRLIIYNSIQKHIRYMKYILNENQYKKYLLLFNTTLQNRGFDVADITSNLAKN